MPAVTCPATHAIDDLTELNRLVECQCKAGLSREEVLDALHRSWTSRLLSLGNCSDAHKAHITEAITSGPWTSEQRKALARILIEDTKACPSPLAKRRPNQKCPNFENFIPAPVWVKLRDAANVSLLSRASLLANVGHSLGIECPDQPTLYRMASVIAHCDRASDMGQTGAHALMDKLQTFLKAPARKAGLPYLESYPCSASLLPAPILTSAYPDGELPVGVDIPELSMALGGAKMRGRGKTSGASVPDWLHHVPQEFRDTVMDAYRKGCDAAGPSVPVKVEPPPSTSSPAASPLPDASVLRFRIKSKMDELAAARAPKSEHAAAKSELIESELGLDCGEVVDAAELAGMVPPEPKGMVQPGPKVADAGSIGDMEAQFLAATKSGKSPPPAAKAMKRPAAVALFAPPASGCKKRPASAAAVKAPDVDMSDVFHRIKDRPDVSRNCFCSKAYHPARQRMLAAGGTAQQTNDFARAMSSRASALYDRLQ